ncbi:MAG TPA: hypothetical protein VMS17_05975 [Gemmataceae bacterium]|nr:hypothetical protein [Gemmataceae bacterium]
MAVSVSPSLPGPVREVAILVTGAKFRSSYPDLSQMARLQGAATTPMAEAIDAKVRLQGFSP